MNKFVIIRKDLNLDPALVESEGLTIGRLTGNDLVLNHPTVSRTHAGIKDINGDYWVFNLSEANGTTLNGELADQTPLADGDVIQIGPFFLYPKYVADGLMLEVEMTVKPLPVEATAPPKGTGLLQTMSPEQGKTVRLDPNLLAQLQRDKTSPKGTRRLSGTGMLTSMLKPADEQALKIFWDKRKREAGKLATDSPLKPKVKRRLGKAQFNWLPTRDLQRPWPRALFGWATLIVTVLSVIAMFAFKDAYSPGALSTAHARGDFSIKPEIATKVNAGSCTTCHSATASLNTNCAGCHTTNAFHSAVSDKHMKAGLSCLACHAEHHGRNFQPGLVANVACVGCHRDGSGVVSALTGKPIGTPHGGSFGYPVTDGRWTWTGITQAQWASKQLPGATSQFSMKDQFHLIHLSGRQQGRSNCTDCHTAGFEGAAITEGVRESCAACHGNDPADAAAQNANARPFFAEQGRTLKGSVQPAGPLCVSCHAQHGEEKESVASRRTNILRTVIN
ncbi:MAG TPA: FHA domain-containing protein [Blastocatellia bacterium]|nr:FHA domain-containing protein [Blastocatellia bacterium]HMV86249.1 FHA domain-containing protein [Blastocatellia bacterium]HMY71586.1 FHA domain-containing protein [Blastocatellia bacterium]HNG30140.1 FHA domain-containing protein [Blastocatellia bacterium]